VCLSFFFGSLFAEQVRTEMKSFPFLEMHGLPGTGKTTLVEFLWKLLGRENYEGFDPAKATPAAMARNLAKWATCRSC
jgi:Cdc6-like AAA superfamily ATPase